MFCPGSDTKLAQPRTQDGIVSNRTVGFAMRRPDLHFFHELSTLKIAVGATDISGQRAVLPQWARFQEERVIISRADRLNRMIKVFGSDDPAPCTAVALFGISP